MFMKPKNGYSKPLFSGTTFQLQSVDEVQMVFGKTGEKFKSLPTYNGGWDLGFIGIQLGF
jgi:hypothetical protein